MIPTRNAVYTVAEIYKNLSLQDAPFLCVDVDVRKYFPASQARLLESCNRQIPLQTTQVRKEELLALAGFADLKFKYLYTTNEWIPIFSAVDSEEVLKYVRVALEYQEVGLYLILKDFPHERYTGNTPECLSAYGFFAHYIGHLDFTMIEHERKFSLTHNGRIYDSHVNPKNATHPSKLREQHGVPATACHYVLVTGNVTDSDFTFTFEDT
jgi:hypothetical protein